MRVWDAQTRQTLRALSSPAKGTVSALLLLAQPPHMAAVTRRGSGAGGVAAGPQLPTPLVSDLASHTYHLPPKPCMAEAMALKLDAFAPAQPVVVASWGVMCMSWFASAGALCPIPRRVPALGGHPQRCRWLAAVQVGLTCCCDAPSRALVMCMAFRQVC